MRKFLAPALLAIFSLTASAFAAAGGLNASSTVPSLHDDSSYPRPPHLLDDSSYPRPPHLTDGASCPR